MFPKSDEQMEWPSFKTLKLAVRAVSFANCLAQDLSRVWWLDGETSRSFRLLPLFRHTSQGSPATGKLHDTP